MGWFVLLNVKQSRVNLVLGTQLLQMMCLVVLKQRDLCALRLRQTVRVGVLPGDRSWWDSTVSLAMKVMERRMTSNMMCG